MELVVNPKEIEVIAYALGAAVDNEGDKGSEGIGEDRLSRLSETLSRVDELAEADQSATLNLTYLDLDLLEQYLFAVEGMDFDGSDFTAEHEKARENLLSDIEKFRESAVVERQQREAS